MALLNDGEPDMPFANAAAANLVPATAFGAAIVGGDNGRVSAPR